MRKRNALINAQERVQESPMDNVSVLQLKKEINATKLAKPHFPKSLRNLQPV